MAIENILSDLYRDQLAGGQVPDAAKTKGRLYTATGTVSNAAAALATSTYKLVEVPSSAIPDIRTQFDVTSWGFVQIEIGTRTDPTALVNQLKAAGNTVTPFAFADANHGKAWWEVLGLASDPGGHIGIYAHALANATGAGSMKFSLGWLA